ncbi:hypothetical protein FRC12_010451 [Ceratobasidium sp. 428]|nr:hypothetical protein FRC12_010451 [Ceratobasidium sp. 428]
MVIPGPREPKGYALNQMLEPLVNDLIALAAGIELPVFNINTGRIERRLVYAHLSALLVDWMARIKCCGHVGVTAEHNHCLICKMRQCELSLPRGYQSEGYDLRNPLEVLQHKHEWLRTPVMQRKALRLEHGTTFVEFDRLAGFYSFANCPSDGMHLFDHGLTRAIVRDIIYKPGMFRSRDAEEDDGEAPEARFDAFVQRTIFPSHCSRLPPKIEKMGGRMKAEQWRNLVTILPVAVFEAWRVGDTIPDDDIPQGGENTVHFKEQQANAQKLLRRRRHAHVLDEGDPDNMPQLQDCTPSRNPREYFANVMRYCVAYRGLFRHRISQQEVREMAALLERLCTSFCEMNVHLPPSFHCATHYADDLLKFGNPYNTWIYVFESLNRLLININTNGHGAGVLEATMARGFLRRAECYRFVKLLQSIENPTDDDTKTTEMLLKVTRNGPEHERQRGMLAGVLAGDIHFRGQEPIQFSTTPAQVDFHSRTHQPYWDLLVGFCNEHSPVDGAVFYRAGRRPPGGVWIRPQGSALSYSHFWRHGVRYGSSWHHRGRKSQHAYIYGRNPVIIRGVYEAVVEIEGEEYRIDAVMVQRMLEPEPRGIFPWDHWEDHIAIHTWRFDELGPIEAVPLDAFTGTYILSDIEMTHGRYWVTFASFGTEPEDRVNDYD